MQCENNLSEKKKNCGYFSLLKKDVRKNTWVYMMAVPVVLYYIIFCYIPIGGIIIAFQDYTPAKGFFGSDWVGFRHFMDFFGSRSSLKVISNTLIMNLMQIVIGFPAPIILSLMINEVRNDRFKHTFQTISYIPYFIPLVVFCGMIKMFTRSTGIFGDIAEMLGMERQNLLMLPKWFKMINVLTNTYQGAGWGTIIYLATISAIDPNLYEAATIDGAGRFEKIIHVTLPALIPIISIMLIMNIGGIMSSGFEKIILLYNPITLKEADVLSSFVYRRGLQEMDFSFGTAVDLFTSVVNLIILSIANFCMRKFLGESLW